MSDVTMPEMLDELMAGEDTAVTIAEGWSQGRAAYGGLVGAVAVAGIRKAMQDTKPIRSLMGSFVAPAPAGETRVEPRIVREGKNVTQAAADIVSDGAVCFQMLAAFGNSREGSSFAPQRPFRPEPRDSTPLLEPNPFMPPFLKYFDCHWTGGGLPLTGKKDKRLGLWVRHQSDMSNYPIEKIVSLADYPPPIMMSHFSKPPRGVSSLTWSLEFVTPPEAIASDWFYLDFDLDAASNGYSQQSGYIFAEDGTLCALSRQCMVYFE